MEITVNGETKVVGEGLTVQDLLAQLAVDTKTVVVQRNEDIVAREDFGAISLAEGDVLELVRFVGGG